MKFPWVILILGESLTLIHVIRAISLKIVHFENFKSWNTYGRTPHRSISHFHAYFNQLKH